MPKPPPPSRAAQQRAAQDCLEQLARAMPLDVIEHAFKAVKRARRG